jgi:flagellar motor switch protein FliM
LKTASRRNRKEILFQPAIGDWTTYRPSAETRGKSRLPIRGTSRFSENDLEKAARGFVNTIEAYTEGLRDDLLLHLNLFSISCEQLSYSDTLKEIEVPVAEFKAAGNSGTFYICYDMNLASILINSAAGAAALPEHSIGLTEIEENILGFCAAAGMERILSGLETSYINSPNVLFDRSTSENTSFLVLSAELGLSGSSKGKVFMLVPSDLAKELFVDKDPHKKQMSFERLPETIKNNIFVDTAVLLGSTNIPAQQLYGLEDGDVIVLDSSIDKLLPVYICGKHLQLLGQPGIKDDKISVKILNSGSSKVDRVREEILSVPEPVIEEPLEEIPPFEEG